MPRWSAYAEWKRQQALKMPTVTSCAFCGFTTSGPVNVTRAAFAAHACASQDGETAPDTLALGPGLAWRQR